MDTTYQHHIMFIISDDQKKGLIADTVNEINGAHLSELVSPGKDCGKRRKINMAFPISKLFRLVSGLLCGFKDVAGL